MREGLLAVLTHHSTREASRVTGIPRQTLDKWQKSAEGEKILAELRTVPGSQIAMVIERIVAEQLSQYEAALKAGQIVPRDLPVHAGILLDKLARLKGPSEPTEKTWEVEVRFGGARVSEDGGGGRTAEMAGASVRVTGGVNHGA